MINEYIISLTKSEIKNLNKYTFKPKIYFFENEKACVVGYLDYCRHLNHWFLPLYVSKCNPKIKCVSDNSLIITYNKRS